MPRWLYIVLLAAPAAFILRGAGAAPLAVFVLAALALLPLAGLIGVGTERLAERLGPTIGGLLNATFGNAAELIIGLAALAAGLPDVVRASIAGSIIGNALLVLGSAMVIGGWRHGIQLFNARNAGQYASLLALAVVGLVVPSIVANIAHTSGTGREVISPAALHGLSDIVSVVLLFSYLAYIAFSVFGVHAARGGARAPRLAGDSTPFGAGAGEPARLPAPKFREKRPTPRASGSLWERAGHALEHTIWAPALLLAAATVATAVVSEALVGSIEPVAEEIGLSPFFVGLIVLPIVGNAAEHATALTMAARDHMETAMAITAGSSIQVALLVAPVLVLASSFLGTNLDLNFTGLELAIFALVAVIYAIISLDGESTWLEGVLLLAFYVIVGAGAFFVPA